MMIAHRIGRKRSGIPEFAGFWRNCHADSGSSSGKSGVTNPCCDPILSGMPTEPEIKARFEMRAPFLNERTRRLAAAAEAAAIGRGGIARVARATGVSWCAMALP